MYGIKFLSAMLSVHLMVGGIFAGEELPYKTICVSLGWNCQPAMAIKKNGLRCAAFPLDWNQTSFNGLCSLLEHMFVDFLNPQYLEYSRPKSAGIFNNKYNVTFPHDFPVIRDKEGIDHIVNNYIDYLPTIEEKYKRRIQRLYTVCSMACHVYFFRTCPRISDWPYDINQGKSEAIALREVLSKLFPQNNWTLVVMNHDDSYRLDWHEPQIKNFYLEDPGAGDFNLWRRIFTELGLCS